ncbi:MAG TPA: DddA-like double-stranded DNA deaminase toxin [Actinocatenispora sp.]
MAQLQSAAESLRRGLAGLGQARSAVERAASHTTAATTAATDPRPGQAATAYRAALSRADEAHALINASMAALGEYLEHIGAQAASPPSSSARPRHGTPDPGGEQTSARGASTEPEPIGPQAPVPAYVQRIADDFQHVRPPSTQTVGYLSGTPLHDGRIISGADGPARDAPGLNPDYPVSRWETALKHVESHAAALLRHDDAPTEAVLVVSKEPCGGPRGCQVVLPRILPSGTTLHVYLAEPDRPVRWYDSYPGNGRGLAR